VILALACGAREPDPAELGELLHDVGAAAERQLAGPAHAASPDSWLLGANAERFAERARAQHGTRAALLAGLSAWLREQGEAAAAREKATAASEHALELASASTLFELEQREAALTRLVEADQRVVGAQAPGRLAALLRERGVSDATSSATVALVAASPGLARERELREREASLSREALGLVALLRERFGSWRVVPGTSRLHFDAPADRARYDRGVAEIDRQLAAIEKLEG
jgi:hypothetical protein